MSREVILIEDKRFDVNTIPKKVLKGVPDPYRTNAKSRVFADFAEEEENEVNLNENLLNFVTDGLKFDTEVVRSTCAHTLSYKPAELQQIFNNKTQLGNNVRILQKTGEPKPLRKWPKVKVNKTQELVAYDEEQQQPVQSNRFKLKEYFVTDKQATLAIEGGVTSLQESQELSPKTSGVFLTETSLQQPPLRVATKSAKLPEKEGLSKSLTNLSLSSSDKQPKKTDWDDYLVSKLSENTARWIIAKKTDSRQKEKLLGTLERIYGKSTKREDDIQLYEDSLSEASEDFRNNNNKSAKKTNWKRPSEVLLSPINHIEVNPSDIPLYRLPQGIRRQIKQHERDLENIKYNRTAQNIQVEHKRALSAKTFQEIITDKVNTTNTIFLTENGYQLEMTNGNTEHAFTENKDEIQLKNGKKFSKKTQIVYPKQFTDWIHDNKAQPVYIGKKRPTRGHKRWTDLPKDINENEMNKPQALNELGQVLWNLVLPTTPDVRLKKLVKTNSTVAYIVEEWRRRWQIGSRWACAEIDELIKDMKNIHANIRFQAVVVCSRAAEFTDQQNQNLDNNTFGSDDEQEYLKSDDDEEEFFKSEDNKKQTLKDIKSLPEKLFVAIECLLEDTNDKVRLAAAITIFTVERNKSVPKAKEKAEKILRDTLECHNLADKYAAAQCLAADGRCEYKIILTLLQNYFTSNEQVTREQMTKLLSSLSRKSYLVNSMIGEYLNSDEMRNKILACKILPCLRRALNKDLTAKLIHLMWNDNDRSVRKVAAQTLGRTGRGQNVHEELSQRLQSNDVYDRMEALRKINYLGVMTAKLLVPYLKCFRDDYISVRDLACKAAQKLQVRDENIIQSLLELAQYDKIPKVKARAIETLGLVCSLRDDVKSCLLWALRYELDPIVRAEACHSLVLLAGQEDEEVVSALQERYLIEDEATVKAELNDALQVIGVDPGEDMPILTQIKDEVRKLNTKEIIWSKIKNLEKEMEFQFNKKRFIYSSDSADKEDEAAVAVAGGSILSSPRHSMSNAGSEKTTKTSASTEKPRVRISTENVVFKDSSESSGSTVKSPKKQRKTSMKQQQKPEPAPPVESDAARNEVKSAKTVNTDYLTSIEVVTKENEKQQPQAPVSTKQPKSKQQKQANKETASTSVNKSFLSQLIDDEEPKQPQQQQPQENENKITEETDTEMANNANIDTIYEDSQEILS